MALILDFLFRAEADNQAARLRSELLRYSGVIDLVRLSRNDDLIFELPLVVARLDLVVLLEACDVVFDFDVARALQLHRRGDVSVINLIRFNVINCQLSEEEIVALYGLFVE